MKNFRPASAATVTCRPSTAFKTSVRKPSLSESARSFFEDAAFDTAAEMFDEIAV